MDREQDKTGERSRAETGPARAAAGPPRIFYAIAILWLALDLWTKQLALVHLKGHSSTVIFPDFFSLTFSTNTGAAFGLFADQPLLLAATTTLLLAWMVWLAKDFDWRNPLVALGGALTAGGAAGNLHDRFVHGCVVDFLDFVLWGWHYPTFNIADTGICVGLALVALAEWKKIGRHT